MDKSMLSLQVEGAGLAAQQVCALRQKIVDEFDLRITPKTRLAA